VAEARQQLAILTQQLLRRHHLHNGMCRSQVEGWLIWLQCKRKLDTNHLVCMRL
jgi:hypothetical protein